MLDFKSALFEKQEVNKEICINVWTRRSQRRNYSGEICKTWQTTRYDKGTSVWDDSYTHGVGTTQGTERNAGGRDQCVYVLGYVRVLLFNIY